MSEFVLQESMHCIECGRKYKVKSTRNLNQGELLYCKHCPGTLRKTEKPAKQERTPFVNNFLRISTQIRLGMLGTLVSILLGIILVMELFAREEFLQQSKNTLQEGGLNIVSQLSTRINAISAITKVTSEAIPGVVRSGNEALLKKFVKDSLNFKGDASIAGGGFWPLPNKGLPQKNRASIFYGRNEKGKMIFYDDYNQPAASPYSKEEWFVPARYIDRDATYWSRSYYDIYSKQDMVTCTSPVYNGNSFTGVITVDLKLSGLASIVEEGAKRLDAYAFLLDRNDKFITYPDMERVRISESEAKENKNLIAGDTIFIDRLAKQEPKFAQLKEDLDGYSQGLVETYGKTNEAKNIASKIQKQAASVSKLESERIASIIMASQSANIENSVIDEFLVEKDHLLKEAVDVYLFRVPQTFWHLVLVKPRAKSTEAAQSISLQLILYVFLFVSVSFIFLNGFFKRRIVRPLESYSSIVQEIGDLVNDRKFDKLEELELPHAGNAEIAELGNNVTILADDLNHTYENMANLSQAFERFVPKQFLHFLEKENITQIQLGDHIEREMTVFFSDIRSFTTLSESMTPTENFQFLNDYLRTVGPRIRDHYGFIDKYIGDAIMALFPRKPDDAIEAGIHVLAELREFNKTREIEHKMTLNVGAGIHIGKLMLGTIGEHERMDGTVIADAVNLASRVEGLTKYYRTHMIITGEMKEKLHEPSKFHLRYLESLVVKGKKEPVELFEVLDADPHLYEAKKKTMDNFLTAGRLFHAGKFDLAKERYEECLRECPDDGPAQYFLSLIKEYEEEGLPADWTNNSARVMHEK